MFCPHCKKKIDAPARDEKFRSDLLKLVDGTKTSEELCVITGKPRAQIYKVLIQLRKETGKKLPLKAIPYKVGHQHPRGPNDHHKIFCEYQLGSTFKTIAERRQLSSSRVRDIYNKYLRSYKSLRNIDNKHWEEFDPKDEKEQEEDYSVDWSNFDY